MALNEEKDASGNPDDADRDEENNDIDEAAHNDSAMGMDDATGSEGDIQKADAHDGGSYGSGYGTGSDGDDDSETSGTKRSGVSGNDGGSAGGRSQY